MIDPERQHMRQAPGMFGPDPRLHNRADMRAGMMPDAPLHPGLSAGGHVRREPTPVHPDAQASPIPLPPGITPDAPGPEDMHERARRAGLFQSRAAMRGMRRDSMPGGVANTWDYPSFDLDDGGLSPYPSSATAGPSSRPGILKNPGGFEPEAGLTRPRAEEENRGEVAAGADKGRRDI